MSNNLLVYLFFCKNYQNMPKVKTNSSAKKRFRVTATGKITHKQAGKRHNLNKKSQRRIRNLRKGAILSDGHSASILKFKMPYNR
jgi:large subunit ribosomal protein L35